MARDSQSKKMDRTESTFLRRATTHFSLGTLLSRMTGFAREQATAFYFGASPEIATFFMAYRFALLFRRFLGEGAFLGGFTSYYVQAKAESQEKAAAFFRDFTVSLVGLVAMILLFCEIGIFLGWHDTPIGRLMAWMLPSLLFACSSMVVSALLQSERSFFMPGAAPLMFNLVFICAIWASRIQNFCAVSDCLAIGVTFGFMAQWLLLLPSLRSSCRALLAQIRWRSAQFFPVDVRRVISAVSLTFIGIGASQINTALDALFARLASPSGPAYLHYASRLYQMPLSLVGIAFASALLPALARTWQLGRKEEFYFLWSTTLLKSFAIAALLSLGLLLLGLPGLSLVYGHGEFNVEAVWQSTYCLWGYAIGLVPAIGVLILTAGYSARCDFVTPLKAALIAILVNIGANSLIVMGFRGGAGWIALSTSLSAYLNAGILWRALDPRDKKQIQDLLARWWWRIVVAMCVSALVYVYTDADLFTWLVHQKRNALPLTWGAQCQSFLSAALRFGVFCLLSAWLFGLLAFIMPKQSPDSSRNPE